MSRNLGRAGWTLPEVLVVIGVLSVMFSLLLPAVQSIRAAASRLACQNQMKQLGIAIHAHDATFGHLPHASDPGPAALHPDSVLSRLVPLLPYVEQDALHGEAVRAAARSADPNDQAVHWAGTKPVRPFACPADSRLSRPFTDRRGRALGMTSFLLFRGSSSSTRILPGAFLAKPGIPLTAVTDGLSNTVFAGERPPPSDGVAGWWYADSFSVHPTAEGPHTWFCFGCETANSLGDPCMFATRGEPFRPGSLTNPCDRLHVWSLHPLGGNFLLGDGSVRFVPYSASPILVKLIGINDGSGSSSDLP